MDGMMVNPPFPRNYARELLAIERGTGVYLVDTSGKRYLDLGAGIAVNALGYGRRDLARIVRRQARKVVHVSNLYTTPPAIELATLLRNLARNLNPAFEAVQFGNSGTEANEAALKYARLVAMRTKGPGHHKLLSLSHSFHGRTMGALSVTPKAAYREPFEPLIPETYVTEFNDAEGLERTLTDQFAAVIVEVVQGEGGLRVMDPEFATALTTRCRALGVMLIVDEVQTGLGRTGTVFASEQAGLEPDMITLSKPLAGGLPLSATVITAQINGQLKPGDHGTTFGGGPVTAAVGAHVVKTVTAPDFLRRVRERAVQMTDRLDQMVASVDICAERRGMGMLQGIALDVTVEQEAEITGRILTRLRERGVLVLKSAGNVVRLAPPLVITADELDRGMDALANALAQE
jgi:acetylornithine/succinyldiaminopimelate/putrescine aminotransferase